MYIRKCTDADIETIHEFNRLSPEVFPELKQKHLDRGHWWLAHDDEESNCDVVGFAGMVPFDPCPNTGYLKRAYVMPEARGNGLQTQFIQAREKLAKEIGWSLLVSECRYDNIHSANNFIKGGFKLFEPEQPWAVESLYWKKQL